MSLTVLMLVFTSRINEQDTMVELRNYLARYPFSIHLETMRGIVYLYYHKVQEDPLAPLNEAFIFLLHDLIFRIDLTEQSELIQGLSRECLLLVIDQCLKGCTSQDLEVQQVCYALLEVCCSESVITNKETLSLIKTRLGQPDAFLFETSELFELAKEAIVAEKDSSEDPFYGAWIERLLTSPRFAAVSTPKVLKQLCDRYRLMVTSLNQSEQSHLMTSFQHHIPQHDKLQVSLIQLNQNTVDFPGKREGWLSERNLLVESISSSLVNALLLQLEDGCELQKFCELPAAEKAFATLYRYYTQMFPILRNDLLLRAVDCAYSPMRDDITELEMDQRSVMLGWAKRYLPQDLSVQTSLPREEKVVLYNSLGQEIGFLNESNHAVTFVDGALVLMGAANGVAVNDPVYDEQGSVIGYLTQSGQVRSADLQQKNRCAYLLALVPIKDLEQSSDGLELLIKNMLFEDSIEVLYVGDYQVVDSEKRLWLEWRLSSVIKKTELVITPKTFDFLVNYHSDETIFTLLSSINEVNALSLFHAILRNEKKRDVLFAGLFASEFNLFMGIGEYDSVLRFLDYLLDYHDKSWFVKGLVCFATYAKKQKNHGLFYVALDMLSEIDGKDEEQRTKVDKILQKLVGSEESAGIILNQFLDVSTQMEAQDPQVMAVAQYFDKKHLIVALETLNNTSNWENSSLYKLVLHIFAAQYAHLFPAKELNRTTEQSWQPKELNILAQFIMRHLAKRSSLDLDFTLGHKILGELIFRSASSGQISLFYNKKVFNPAIARLSFTRSFLEQLVDKFWIPEGIKEQFTSTLSRIKAWFDELSPLKKELEPHQMLMDWRHLIKQTWNDIDKKKLPIICAYLLNFSGSKKPLLFLLRDYFNTFHQEPEYLHPVVKLLSQFSQRDVSAVLFDALEAVAIKKPYLLDKTMLHHMAHYYTKKIKNQEVQSPQAELDLLTYFGQNKYYFLVQKGCEVLAKGCDDKIVTKQLLKAANEARVENDLSASIGRFYFGFIKLIIRIWYYGFNAEKKSSGIIKFCDDPSPYPPRKRAVEQVEKPIVAGKVANTYLEFSEKRKQLIRLLATITHSQAPASLSTRASQNPQSMFNGVLQTKSCIEKTAVPAEQAVVHI